MKLSRLLAVALTLGVVALPGCIITSAQILGHFALRNPFTINSSLTDHSERIPVDLNVKVSEYRDNKDKLKGLSDLAILGKFTNVSGPSGGVLVYIVPDFDPNDQGGGAPSIPTGAVRLWGPAEIGPTGDSRTIGWDESAKLFDPAGKAVLISEMKGDGQFTLYTTGSAGTFNIRVDDGVLALVIDAGL